MAAGLPVVLRVELPVLVAPLWKRVLRGLSVGVEHAGRRVRVAVPGVEGVARVVDEVDLTVEAGEDALRLEAVLEVEASFRRVGSPDLRHVRDDVVGDVLVGERATVGLIEAGVVRAPAAEAEVGDVVRLERIREEQRHRGESRRRAEQVRVLELIIQRVGRASPTELEGRRRVQDAGRGEHVVRAGVHEEHRHREVVAAVAGPRGAVRLQDVFLVLHVTASDAPIVRRLEVHSEQVFAARRAVGVLARVVEAGAAREVRLRVNVESGDAGRVQPVRGDPAEHAAVSEAAAGVGGTTRKPGREIADVGERVAAGVDALGEVTPALEGRRHTALPHAPPGPCAAATPGSRRRTASSCFR